MARASMNGRRAPGAGEIPTLALLGSTPRRRAGLTGIDRRESRTRTSPVPRFDSGQVHVYAEEWLTCLDPECGAPAVADEPIQHDSTNGLVLSWVVHCANGHHLADYTEPIWGFDTPRE